jgi:hypothetical protein
MRSLVLVKIQAHLVRLQRKRAPSPGESVVIGGVLAMVCPALPMTKPVAEPGRAASSSLWARVGTFDHLSSPGVALFCAVIAVKCA